MFESSLLALARKFGVKCYRASFVHTQFLCVYMKSYLTFRARQASSLKMRVFLIGTSYERETKENYSFSVFSVFAVVLQWKLLVLSLVLQTIFEKGVLKFSLWLKRF